MKRSIQTVALFVAIGLLTYCGRPNVMFPQFQQNWIVVWSITKGIDEIYSQNVANLPSGNQDINVSCSGGGSVHITGTTGQAGLGTYDLVYELDNCLISIVDGSLIVSLALSGTLNHRNGAAGLNYESNELSMKGNISYGFESADVDKKCYFKSTYIETSVSGAQAGQLCDRPVTWSYSHQDCTG